MALGVSKEIERLEAGKQALQQLLAISQSLESLRLGLESSLELGKPQFELSSDAIQLYLSLGSQIRNLPDEEIKRRLVRLDKHVTDELKNIVPLVQSFASNDHDLSSSEITAISEQIDAFHRLAKTSVTLRVVLDKRGLQVPGLELPFPETLIRSRLASIESQEKQLRNQADAIIVDMENDLRSLLQRQELQEDMRNALESALEDMGRNRQHIKSGLSIRELPVAFETLNFGNQEMMFSPTAAAVELEITDAEEQQETDNQSDDDKDSAKTTPEVRTTGNEHYGIRKILKSWFRKKFGKRSGSGNKKN